MAAGFCIWSKTARYTSRNHERGRDRFPDLRFVVLDAVCLVAVIVDLLCKRRQTPIRKGETLAAIAMAYLFVLVLASLFTPRRIVGLGERCLSTIGGWLWRGVRCWLTPKR